MNQNLQEIFNLEYQKLNPEQREAVDEIYGPVMVVAGPGTGKTQLLSVRVCNILLQTDLSPHNILCLTYTDAGATAMRKRLSQMMGSEAYKVCIMTYHSFCNMVIRENPHEFQVYRELRNAESLEIAEILIEIIDNLPKDHPNKRLIGDIYFDRRKLNILFDTMKKEGWTPEYIARKIEEYLEELPTSDKVRDGRIKKEFVVSEAKLNKELENISFLRYYAPYLHQYNQALLQRNLIDFNDSILNVLHAFKTNKNLLANYQERFQFILADEYQDTNGSQNDIIFTLVENDFDDSPNVFVVGDDDQAIYKFQGANLDNIITFKDKFNPKIIVLKNNYRSYQGILDSAKTLISNNGQRLINRLPELNKDLIESRTKNRGVGGAPHLYVLTNKTNHDYKCVELIKSIHKRGVPLSKIAVIYQKHKESEDIIKYLSYSGIPVSIKKRVNILEQREIIRLIHLVKYIVTEVNFAYSGNADLFGILHFEFWGTTPRDVAKLALYASRKTNPPTDDLKWRDIIADLSTLQSLGLDNSEAIQHASSVLESLIIDYANDTPQVFFEKLLTKTGILDDIISGHDRSLRLSLINTFFDFIKNETAADANQTLEEVLLKLSRMEEFDISLSLNHVTHSNEGVNFMTAHSSKGLEFEEVILLNVSNGYWKPTANNAATIHYPDNLTIADVKDGTQDYRRLFYVALTRAENNVHLLHSSTNAKGEENLLHLFANEIGFENTVPVMQNDEEAVLEFTTTLLRYDSTRLPLIDHDLIDLVLETLSLNATAINKYLRCAYSFYFENILRVPQARSANMGFGNALHQALERFILMIDASPSRTLPPLSKFTELVSQGMDSYRSHFNKQDYDNLTFLGQKLAVQIYDKNVSKWTGPRKFLTEHEVKVMIGDVPMSGKIDRIDIYDDRAIIIDYKTGKHSSEKHKKAKDEEIGGDYWRQAVVYDLLLDQDVLLRSLNRKIEYQYIGRDKELKDIAVELGESDRQIVLSQIKEVYKSVKAHKFDIGCGEPTCTWCNFVKNNMPLVSPLANDANEERE